MSTAIFRCDDYYDIMKELLRHPDVDPNERDDEGKTPLFHAVSAGNIGAVAQLLEKHDVDLNRADNCKSTPLAIAISNGSYGMVAYLLASPKIERSLVNSSGDSALSLAARLGHLFIVEQLLDHNNTLCQRKQCASGSNGMSQEESFDMASFVNCKVDGGDTPLIVACRAGQDAVALALLAVKGIGINDKGHLGDTALMATVRHGKDTIMDMLLSFEGVDVNEQNDDGDTPLIAAARYGRETAANRLLQRNDVQVNARNKVRETAFKIAVKCQSPVVHYLLDNSTVEKDTSDELGNTPLLAAAQAGRHHMVMVLVESDIYNLESLDSSGRHLLSHAASYGWEDVVSTVLSKDLVNCKHSDQNGRDALSYAAASLYDPLSVVQRLIDRGFDPDLPDKNGRTPLSYAAENDCREILAYLLSLPEVSVDKPDTRGRTPLSYAVGRHNLNVVKRLLSIKEVEPDSMDKTNATPLLYAVLAVVNESPRIGNEKLLAARFSSRYQYIDRDAEVIKALLNSRRVNPDRTFSSDQYMPIHIAAALGYEEAVLALLPWVRPRERLVMQKFLGATDMDRVWDFVDANQGWKDRDEELYTRTGWVDVPTTSKLLRQPSWRSGLEEWVSKMAGVKDGKDRRRANH
ncbi:Ankyrin repeat protein [Lasiodiplodia theobromae]|nr:Ankyrin repeat protein [Lasiodiplodia theobromae]